MAVYTKVETTDVEAVLNHFGLGRLRSMRGIAEGVENSNYLIESDQARFILTLYEKRVNRADLPFFLGLMQHLNAAGIPCPLPVENAAGEALFEVKGRPAAIITYLDGVSIENPNAEHCAQLGAALARLHDAQDGFHLSRANDLSIDGWSQIAAKTHARADSVETGLAEIIAAELETLKTIWPQPGSLPEGVIHADLFPDNVFFLKGTLSGLIDFYFACNDAFTYDIAICLNAWCFSSTAQFLPEHAAAVLSGYQGVRPLNTAELNALPVLCRGAALRFLLTRLYDWLNPTPGALVQPKDPRDYLARLKHFQMAEEITG